MLETLYQMIVDLEQLQAKKATACDENRRAIMRLKQAAAQLEIKAKREAAPAVAEAVADAPAE